MTDFLTKPFKPQQLFDAVERWGHPAAEHVPDGAAPGGGGTPLPERSAPVNLDKFRAVMREAGIEQVVSATLATYIDESPGKFKAVLDAAAARDTETIAKTAHALKSASGAIRADTLAALLQQLEDAGAKGDVNQALGLIDLVRKEFDLVVEYVRDHARD